MPKKSRRSREKALSMVLMIVMLVLGVLCLLAPLGMLIGIQYLVFGCLAVYGAVLVARYIMAEDKNKFLLVLLVWLFQSAAAAEEMMSFICCIVLAVLSVSMGINHFMMAFPYQRKDDKARGWLFAAAIVNFIVGVFLVVFPIFVTMPSISVLLGIYLFSGGLTILPEFWRAPAASK